MTTPGAQSTLNLTRIPVESGTATRERSTATTTTASSREIVSGDGDHASAVADSIAVSSATSIPAVSLFRELVPDVPLDEYLRASRYDLRAIRER